MTQHPMQKFADTICNTGRYADEVCPQPKCRRLGQNFIYYEHRWDAFILTCKCGEEIRELDLHDEYKDNLKGETK